MHCFPCFTSPKNKKSSSTDEANVNESTPPERSRPNEIEQPEETTLKTFTFRELATATKNFRQECLLGEGGFGRVYKGTLKNNGHVVAVKQLDKHGLHGSKEFQAEVLSLGRLDHPNLVKLIGYCADGDQRLLVYDYISGGSLHDHLHEQNGEPMDWTRRMQIAYDTAQGIDYLHEKANPPVIYRDLKASNILLDEKFSPKLSDFGLHKLGPGTGDTMMGFSSRVMGTYGYSAPEYTREGTLSMKSDVYSFGVVLLELITGRKAMDTTKPNDEQNLVSWAQPIFRDPKRYPDMADPTMNKRFSERGLNQAVAIASMCVQEEPTARPLISDVMVALSFLSMSTEDGIPKAAPIESFRDKSMSIALSRADSKFVSLEPTMEDDKSCTSSEDDSTSSDNEKEEVSKNMMKKHKENEDSMGESDDECDSNSDDELEKDQNSPSSKPIDEKMAAQSLKIDYRYSWEEVGCNDETLSSKSSHNSNEESTSSRYDSDKDEDDSLMNEEEKEGEKHTHLEHISSSKTDDDEEDDDQSVYFDDDDDSKDDNADSLHQIKSEGDNFIEDKNEKSLHEVK